ncbi:MAG: bacteriohemerythrin [bacterium]
MHERFVWSQKYSVRVDLIDEQHHHFFDLANKVFDELEGETASKKSVLALISELEDYAFYHLRTEEELFEKCKYPEVAAHVEVHNKFRHDVKEYMARVRAEDDPRILVGEIAAFAGSWLFHHILKVDSKYSDCFVACKI